MRVVSSRPRPIKRDWRAILTDAERADYDILKRAGYSREEALRAVGRVDLITATARGRK